MAEREKLPSRKSASCLRVQYMLTDSRMLQSGTRQLPCLSSDKVPMSHRLSCRLRFFFCLMVWVVGLEILCESAVAQPNVILILADDLGYGDLSILGQKRFQTPNIDRLGKEGIIFTQHYSGNTVCSPSRASLMTGQHPGHVHCRANSGETKAALDPTMTTLPRLFKNAGYATGAFGKWGLGETSSQDHQNPMAHGFDQFSGWKSQGIAHTYYPSTIVRNGQEVPLPKGTYVHDLIMLDALTFIDRNAKAKQPFFCYIPTAIPHAAMHAPPELHDKWRKLLPQFDHKIGTYGAGKTETCPPVTNPIAGFAAMVEHLDNQVGELLDLVQKNGIDDHTLIVFASDNGAHKEGGHDPEFWDSNGPFRGIKRDLYEGGIHSPFLARWPAAIAAGSTSDHISAFWDILPTMAELISQPTPVQTDGISMLAALTGNTAQQKQHEWLYWEATSPGEKPEKQAARMGKWKAVKLLTKKNAEGTLELYNLETDIGEAKNVAAKEPEIAAKMQSIMNEASIPLER